MVTDDETLRRGYWYIMHNPRGFVEGLDGIDERLAGFFANSGIISFGINSQAQIRYKVTAAGEELAELGYRMITSKMVRDKLAETKESSATLV